MSRAIEHLSVNEYPASSYQPPYAFHRQNLSERFSDRFIEQLHTLNEIVRESGEEIEGGIFYWNGSNNYVSSLPDLTLAPARRNLWRAARFKSCMLEVGVNAAHSALLALSSNPNLKFYGVDINWHKYTEPCIEFLQREFQGRVEYIKGDSREVLPYLATHRDNLRIDLFHVDGGHSAEICRTDISNCLRLAANNVAQAHLLLDDINAEWIFDVYCEFVSLGYLQTESFFSDWEDINRNVLSKIIIPR